MNHKRDPETGLIGTDLLDQMITRNERRERRNAIIAKTALIVGLSAAFMFAAYLTFR